MSAVEATPAPREARTGQPLLRLENVVKHFPITSGMRQEKAMNQTPEVRRRSRPTLGCKRFK